MNKLTKFFKNLTKLWHIANSVETVATDKKGNTVIVFTNNCLISSKRSLGFHAEDNLIIESDLLALNTMNKYGAKSLMNTASLMSMSYQGIEYKLSALPEHTSSLCDNAPGITANAINRLLKQASIK